MTEMKEIMGRLKAVAMPNPTNSWQLIYGISRQNINAVKERDDVPPGAESNSNISYCQEGSSLAR